MRTVLVTGAMGQVGKRVVKILLGRGRTVIALDLDNAGTREVAAEFLPGAGTLVQAYADLTDSKALDALVAEHQPAVIVHLAAVVSPVAYRNPGLARRVNVEGTGNLIAAAKALPIAPLFLEASSSAVYGSRNPHTHPERLTHATPTRPTDCYGEDKVLAERLVSGSGLPHATLRIGGIISPDALAQAGEDYDVLVRAFPHDNRIHAVDARDVALAFANAVDSVLAVDGKVLLIGGNESYVLRQSELSDDLMQAIGIGRPGTRGLLPGDPGDENGWGLTDWFDTSEAQTLLDFQAHDWDQTCAWVAASVPAGQRRIAGLLAPLIRTRMRRKRLRENKADGRGQYADPWALIGARYGDGAVTRAEPYG
ncbi:MAG: NAD-dependent epimerase/dehydratase family protein [Marmoricola sp.]